MSFVVVQSVFKDVWVGSHEKEPDEKKFFAKVEDAASKARIKFFELNPDFDNEDEDADPELLEAYEKIMNAKADNVDPANGYDSHIVSF
jgi:hypothetical protein